MVEALRSINSNSYESVPILLEALKEDNSQIITKAIEALNNFDINIKDSVDQKIFEHVKKNIYSLPPTDKRKKLLKILNK